MLAILRSNVISPLSKRLLTGVRVNGLGWGGSSRDWRATTSQVSMFKILDFKTNAGVV